MMGTISSCASPAMTARRRRWLDFGLTSLRIMNVMSLSMMTNPPNTCKGVGWRRGVSCGKAVHPAPGIEIHFYAEMRESRCSWNT
jgi:hypothetical protein